LTVSVEDMNKPDILAQDYEKVGITSKLLAKKHKEELEAHEVKATYDKYRAHFKYSKQLIAWPIRQKARQDAQKNLGLTVDKLEVAGPDGGPIQVLNVNELDKEVIEIAKEVVKKYGKSRKHKPISSPGS